MGPIIFVVDALDECKESELIDLIAGLKRHFLEDKMRKSQVKIFLTSRPYDQVIPQFAGFIRKSPHIHICGEHDSETIAEVNIVVRHRVQVLQNEGKLKAPIANHLEEKLLKMRHRTYLWYSLSLRTCSRIASSKRSSPLNPLSTLSSQRTFFQSYEMILSKSEDTQQARKAFCAILAASRPLTVTEINIAVHVDLGSQDISDLEADEDFEQTLRGWCGLLISISQGKVYLLHQTVHVFLDQRGLTHENHNESAPMPIQKTEAHSFLAKSCIGYISAVSAKMEDSWWASDDSTLYLQEHSFLPYASGNMVDHFNKGGTEEDLVLMVEKLCNPRRREFQLWMAADLERSVKYAVDYIGEVNTLWIASYHGMRAVVERILERGYVNYPIDANTADYRERTPLIVAAQNGHTGVVKMLIDSGKADLNRRDYQGTTALDYCVAWTELDPVYTELTKLLLDTNGIDLELTLSGKMAPHILAIDHGWEDTLKRLIQPGDADVNDKDWDGETTLLSFAAACGYEWAVKFLINVSTIDADAPDDDYPSNTALIWAANEGYNNIVKILIDSGKVDVNKTNGRHETALMVAKERGHDKIVQLILGSGQVSPEGMQRFTEYCSAALYDGLMHFY